MSARGDGQHTTQVPASSWQSTTATLPLLSCTPCVALALYPSLASVVDVCGFTLGGQHFGWFLWTSNQIFAIRACLRHYREGWTNPELRATPSAHSPLSQQVRSGPCDPRSGGRPHNRLPEAFGGRGAGGGGLRMYSFRPHISPIRGSAWMLRSPQSALPLRTSTACFRDLSVSLSCAHEICCTIGWGIRIGEWCWRPFFCLPLQDDTICVQHMHPKRVSSVRRRRGGAIDEEGKKASQGQLFKAAPSDPTITQPTPTEPNGDERRSDGGVIAYMRER